MSNILFTKGQRWLWWTVLVVGLMLALLAQPWLATGHQVTGTESPALAGPVVGPGGGGGCC